MASSPEIKLVWSEPPRRTGGRGRQVDPRLAAVAEELRRNPGQPACIAVYDRAGSAHSLVRRIRRGQGIWGPEGTYWAQSREGKVWAWCQNGVEA